jgi:hypothetical protein
MDEMKRRRLIGHGVTFITAIAIGLGGVWLANKIGFENPIHIVLGIMAVGIPVAMGFGALTTRMLTPRQNSN